ncbi:uncharacterized protein LOC132301471 isoform X1 [Cornus florida]|uniref:uncharacterized protein LOC132301471 isoform X1 n=1 Tax=Cornus florida TaxID=4283 RepID=UPI00289C5E5D|nr:uncharacterized protein LOC132301471 isoform X1 [Cornus florida]
MVMLMKGQVSPNFGTTLVVRRNFILTGKQYSSRWKYNLNDNHCSNFAAYYPGKQGGGETQTRAHLLKSWALCQLCQCFCLHNNLTNTMDCYGCRTAFPRQPNEGQHFETRKKVDISNRSVSSIAPATN